MNDASYKIPLRNELLLYPCPVVLVSCKGVDGPPNIITISWAGIACSHPEIITIAVKPTRHSFQLIRESGEFVINIPSRDQLFIVDKCGTLSGRNHNKFELCNLTPIEINGMSVPYIKECPINIACKTMQIIELGSHHLFIARVLVKLIDASLSCQNEPLANRLQPLAYIRPYYYSIDDKLEKYGYTSEGEKQ